MLKRVVDSRLFTWSVVGLIMTNAVTIGLATYPSIAVKWGSVLDILDDIILGLFTLEIALRFLASEPKMEYFRTGWNMFDVAIVAIGYLPSSQYFTILRVFRLLRVLRTLTVLPNLRKIVVAFLGSLPALGHIIVMLAILHYVYGTLGTILFARAMPERFGTLHDSVVTMFSVLTLDGWTQYYDVVSKSAMGVAVLRQLHRVWNVHHAQFFRWRHRHQSSRRHRSQGGTR